MHGLMFAFFDLTFSEGTPLAGHRDNHGLYMNSTQISKLQKEVGVPEGAEWTPLEGFPPKVRENINALLSTCAFGPSKPDRSYFKPDILVRSLSRPTYSSVSSSFSLSGAEIFKLKLFQSQNWHAKK